MLCYSIIYNIHMLYALRTLVDDYSTRINLHRKFYASNTSSAVAEVAARLHNLNSEIMESERSVRPWSSVI